MVDVPEEFLGRAEVREALRRRDVGTLFRLLVRHQGLTQARIAAVTGLTQARVSRLVSSPDQRVVHIDVIERISDGLRVPGAMLGLAPRPWEAADDGHVAPRRGGLLTGAAAHGALLDALGTEPGALRAALTSGSVDDGGLTELERLADTLGVAVVRRRPVEVLPEALDSFRTARLLLGRLQRTRDRERLVRVAGRLATVVGEVLFNEGDFRRARQWYATALLAAEDVGDGYGSDIALAGHAYLAIYADDPRGVLRLLSGRLDTGPTAPTPALAWLWAFAARAHAVAGDALPAERALGRARETLAGSRQSLVRPGVFSFLPQKLAFYEAAALVATGRPDRARDAADRALRAYDPSETTEPTLVRFERASALVQSGDVGEACRVAVGAVLDPRMYPSVTVRGRARAFSDLLHATAGPRSEAVRTWREVAAGVVEHAGAPLAPVPPRPRGP